MSDQTLGFIVLAGWLVCEGMAIGYRAGGKWPERPLPGDVVSVVVVIAALWLAIRAVF